jgi:hypothetical protein
MQRKRDVTRNRFVAQKQKISVTMRLCRKKVVSSLRGVVIRFATLELELALVAFKIVMSKGNCEKGSVEKVPWWTMVQILPGDCHI